MKFRNMTFIISVNDTDVFQSLTDDTVVIVTHGFEDGSLDMGLDMAITAIEEMGWRGNLKDLNILCCYPNQVRYADGQAFNIIGEWNGRTDYMQVPTNNDETIFTLFVKERIESMVA